MISFEQAAKVLCARIENVVELWEKDAKQKQIMIEYWFRKEQPWYHIKIPEWLFN